MNELGGLQCFWSDLDKHPRCPHGPTLLFGRHHNGELEQFYNCSACRDRKLCTFYAEKGVKLTEAQKKAWKEEGKRALPLYNHRRLFIRFNQATAESPEKRAYCHTCDKLVLFAERSLHASHDSQLGLTDEEINNPTKILKPLANVKKEAQYLFSTKATAEMINMLVKAGAEQVLCIGAPRIHEYINENLSHKMSSLLLDFDGRFHNFFGPLNYCWYNLFNHHFFTEEAAQTFRDFITQNGGKNTFVVCDPPFGGRVEAISQTMKTISDQHKKLNDIKTADHELKIIFVFPYFMESIMQRKANPPGIEGGLKGLKMSDYKVDYENHPLFLTGSGGRKFGSPVRIFTNISLKLLELPAEDGYKLCSKCQKWIYAENKHCKKCKACTSKDGRQYKHCDICERCVKPTWKHCEICERCTLEKHVCGGKPRVSGRCFKCGELDHVEKDCGQSDEVQSSRKRKNVTNDEAILGKKRRIVLDNTSNSTVQVEKQKQRKNTGIATKKDKLQNTVNSIGKLEKKKKKTKKTIQTTSAESSDFENEEKLNNRTNGREFVAGNNETECSPTLTAKEAKKLRRMKKKAPIEWVQIDNGKKQKNKSNGKVAAAINEKTNIPAELTSQDEKKKMKKTLKKKSAPGAKLKTPKNALKLQTSSVSSKPLKNVDKTIKKWKIKRT